MALVGMNVVGYVSIQLTTQLRLTEEIDLIVGNATMTGMTIEIEKTPTTGMVSADTEGVDTIKTQAQ